MLRFSLPTTIALVLTNKDTEYEFVIPKEATKVVFQPRADADIQLSTSKGGSNTAELYHTIPKRSVGNGPIIWENMALRQDLTVYVRSGVDGNALEVQLFQ